MPLLSGCVALGQAPGLSELPLPHWGLEEAGDGLVRAPLHPVGRGRCWRKGGQCCRSSSVQGPRAGPGLRGLRPVAPALELCCLDACPAGRAHSSQADGGDADGDFYYKLQLSCLHPRPVTEENVVIACHSPRPQTQSQEGRRGELSGAEAAAPPLWAGERGVPSSHPASYNDPVCLQGPQRRCCLCHLERGRQGRWDGKWYPPSWECSSKHANNMPTSGS